MSEMDKKDMEDVIKLIKLILNGYTKVTGILEHKATLGEIRSFMTGFLVEESDVNFKTFILTVQEIRDIIKSDRHE